MKPIPVIQTLLTCVLLCIISTVEVHASVAFQPEEFKNHQLSTNIPQAEVQAYFTRKLKNSRLITYALSFTVIILVSTLIILINQYKRMYQKSIDNHQKNLKFTAAEALIKGQEIERKKLAHQLHDKVGNHIAHLKNHLLSQRENDSILLGLVQEMSKEVRNISQDLMPQVLIRFGLTDALKELCYKYREQSNAIIDINIQNGAPIPIHPEEEVNVYRIIQEILKTSLFCFKSNYVLINITWSNNDLKIHVEDNGNEVVEDQIDVHSWKFIEHRINYLKGRFKRVNSNEGNEYYIQLPNRVF